MRIVAGLGNPGPEYAWTRHNAGFMTVQKIADSWGVSFERRGSNLEARYGTGADCVRLVLPQSYMNRSGSALRELGADAAAEDLLVVFDDVDLPEGSVRVRKSGGAGGHRGVASVVEHFGRDFIRVRVGVGRPSEGEDTADYVLQPLTPQARAGLADGIDRAAAAVLCALTEGADVAMNRFNGAPASAES